MTRSSGARKAKRKVALRKKRHYAARVAEANRFPEVIIERGSAPEALADAVRVALKETRFGHARLLPRDWGRFFRAARQFGFRGAFTRLRRAFSGRPSDRALLACCLQVLGQAVFDHLPPKVVAAYLPYHFPEIHLGMYRSNCILVRIRSLLRAKSSGGTVYYSRHRPTLAVAGQCGVVGFSDHAVQQICDRTVFNWRTYVGCMDAFAFLDKCVYFQDCTAQVGRPCFTVWNICADETFFTSEFARQVLGHLDPKRHYYRVGYCPAVLEGGFIKAKTLLLPGMRGTPEWAALQRAAASPQREQMAAQAGAQTLRELARTGDFSLVKWFHVNAAPQVVAFDHPVFRYD